MNRDLVQKQIDRLKTVKPKVPHHTFFGDDNWAAIDAMVQTLEHTLQIGYVPTEDWLNRTFQNGDEESLSLYDAGQEVVSWLQSVENGATEDESPAAGWEELTD